MQPYPFGSAVGAPVVFRRSTAQHLASPLAESDEDESATVTKIIDWSAVGLATVDFLLCATLGLAALGSGHPFAVLLVPGALVALVVIVQKLAGTVFDRGHGTVRFYSYWLPREVPLAAIRDANCQFAMTLSPSHVALAIFGGSGKRGGGNGQRTYMVNLSGDFGSRQLRFYGKRWRDQFLSELRDQAPGCRITRWR